MSNNFATSTVATAAREPEPVVSPALHVVAEASVTHADGSVE